MSSNEDFFASRKAAAVFKHGILARYPVVFAAKAGMAVENHRVTFLDGYAGRGQYDAGEPGSPLLLVRSAEQVEKFRQVRGVFVERDDDNYANLCRVLADQSGTMPRELFHCSLDECLPEILQMVEDDALFAFLDPFGPALDYALLRSGLLGRPSWPPTEVLLHFSVLSVARMGGALRKARTGGAELSASDQKSAERLDRFLGGDWWQAHFATVHDEHDEQRATDAALTVADRYRAMVTAQTGFMSVSMPVRPRPDLQPKYVLVLFTRHREGVWCFADALGKAGREWNEACLTEESNRRTEAESRRFPGQLSIFEPEPVAFDPDKYERDRREGWVKTIAANILRLVDSIGSFQIADRVPEVYGTTLGSAWIPHIRAAVRGLHHDGFIVNSGKGDRFHYDPIRRS